MISNDVLYVISLSSLIENNDTCRINQHFQYLHIQVNVLFLLQSLTNNLMDLQFYDLQVFLKINLMNQKLQAVQTNMLLFQEQKLKKCIQFFCPNVYFQAISHYKNKIILLFITNCLKLGFYLSYLARQPRVGQGLPLKISPYTYTYHFTGLFKKVHLTFKFAYTVLERELCSNRLQDKTC